MVVGGAGGGGGRWLYNWYSGTNLKHTCAALGINVGTPAYMKMAIEIRLRDLKFGKWESFELTADEWAVRETDDTVHEKLGIVHTIKQMKVHLRSLVLYPTGGSSGAAARTSRAPSEGSARAVRSSSVHLEGYPRVNCVCSKHGSPHQKLSCTE